jgi:hypothetical protein
MSTPIVTPKKLAIYYGWPSAVNGANLTSDPVAAAVVAFKDYDQLVLGAGLEDPSHGDYANTIAILAHPDMANTTVYGYIDATLSLDTVQGKIDNWYTTGVQGIFYDQFGYDYGLTREVQRELVWCAHEKGTGLKAFVNAWNPDDAFSNAVHANNPNGLETRLGANDYYLAESFAIINGAYDDNDLDTNGIKDFQDKADKMVNYRTLYGTKLAAITTSDSSPFDQAKADYSYLTAVVNQFDSWGYGEEYFSASSVQLPFRTRASFDGTKFTSAVLNGTGIIYRYVNIDIVVDTVNHIVGNLIA